MGVRNVILFLFSILLLLNTLLALFGVLLHYLGTVHSKNDVQFVHPYRTRNMMSRTDSTPTDDVVGTFAQTTESIKKR